MKERYLKIKIRACFIDYILLCREVIKQVVIKRGIFSASILIVSRKSPPISLRVDYSTNPLKKLKELISKSNTRITRTG